MLIIATVLQIIISSCHGSVMPKISKTEGIVNMNGDYLLSNSHPNGKWDSRYSKYEAVEYMDVYSPVISTKYGEVFWTMMDPVPLDKDIVDKFSGKIMAVVGYETDQQLWSGAMSEMIQVTRDL